MRPLALASLLLAACSKDLPPSPDLAVNQQLIWETVKAYHNAGDKGDVGKMKEVLAPEVSLIKSHEEVVKGIDEVEKVLTDRVKSYEGQVRKTILGGEFISVTGDTGLATYIASVGTHRGVFTVTLRRSGGKWLIAHVHDSWMGGPK